MIDLAKLYERNHRDQQYMLVGGMALALIGSLAPRNERALFVTGADTAPKAFAAIAPPPAAFSGLFDIATPFRPRAYQIGIPRRRSSRGGGVPDGLTNVRPAGATPGDVSPVSSTSSPTQLASLDPTGFGLPGGPLAGSGPLSFGPGATAAGPGAPVVPTDPSAPGGGGSAGPGIPGNPVTPVGAVPEPSTWAMLLLGFFGLGTLFRRGRTAVSSSRVDLLQR
jgi:hypothetical protein